MSTPEIIEDLTERLTKAGNHHSVHVGFRESYVTKEWYVWVDGDPSVGFPTFDELEAWVEGRVK